MINYTLLFANCDYAVQYLKHIIFCINVIYFNKKREIINLIFFFAIVISQTFLSSKCLT